MKADLRDILLNAAAQVQTVMREFEKDLMIPQVQGKAAQLWAGLPDEMKEKFKRENPQAYRALMAEMKGE